METFLTKTLEEGGGVDDDELKFYQAYVKFYLGNQEAAIQLLSKLVPEISKVDVRLISENFCKHDLAFERVSEKPRAKFIPITNFKLEETHLVEFDTKRFASNPFDIVTSVRLRLNSLNFVFNNEYFFLFKSICNYETHKFDIAHEYANKALALNAYNIGSNSIKCMLELINLQTYNKRNQESSNYLNKMFSFKREFLGECYSLNEYYKNKLINALDQSKLNLIGFSKLNLNLIKLYRENSYEASLYFKQKFEDLNSDSTGETDQKDYVNASSVSLRETVLKDNNQNVAKNMDLLKLYFWIVHKQFAKRMYNDIALITIDQEERLLIFLDKICEKSDKKGYEKELINYVNELYYYLGVVHYNMQNYQLALTFFNRFPSDQKEAKFKLVNFYKIVIQKKEGSKSNDTDTIQNAIERMFKLKPNKNIKIETETDQGYSIELDFHIGESYFHIGNYKMCKEIFKEHLPFAYLENKLAFDVSDVYYFKIQNCLKMGEYDEALG